MKKQIIAAVLLALLLAGCSSGTDDKKETGSGTQSPSETPICSSAPVEDAPSEDTATVTGAITEETIPYIPGDVLYSDDNNVGVKNPNDILFFNGKPVSSEEFDVLVGQNMATVTPDYATSPEADKNLPNGIIPPTTTSSVTTKKPDETTIPNENKYVLAEYISTGKTPINISKVLIYNSTTPGLEGVKYFAPGETFFINLWCDTLHFIDTEILLVPHETKHKDSYSEKEIIASSDMLMAHVYGEDQLFCELTIPQNIPAGVYDIRIVCGTEEGYISFYIA